MSRLTDQQWRLGRSVVRLLDREMALTSDDLAKRLGVTGSELRPVLGMLLGRGVIARCEDYLIVAVRPGEGGGTS